MPYDRGEPYTRLNLLQFIQTPRTLRVWRREHRVRQHCAAFVGVLREIVASDIILIRCLNFVSPSLQNHFTSRCSSLSDLQRWSLGLHTMRPTQTAKDCMSLRHAVATKQNKSTMANAKDIASFVDMNIDA